MIKVGVLGAAGRMGTEVCRAVSADSRMELVSAVDPKSAGKPVAHVAGIQSELTVAGDIASFKDAGVEVAVDFTTPSSVAGNIAWCLKNSVHAVVGTTGISGDDLKRFAKASEGASANIVVAPNFAIGAVLMMRFAGLAARWLPDAEIVELHHEGKLDSPSGTSLGTADAIIAGRPPGEPGDLSGDASDLSSETIPGARGANRQGVRVHSVRLPGLVAHQTVILGGPGQTLSIRHDSIDRSSFMPGVLLAIREVSKHPGLTFGLQKLLGLD